MAKSRITSEAESTFEPEISQELRQLARALAAHLDWLGRSGLGAVPRWDGTSITTTAASAHEVERVDQLAATTAASSQVVGRADPLGPAAAVSPEELPAGAPAAARLEALREAIGDCRRCRLAGGRTQIVFGVGNPEARLLFVGEGPGRDEDLQGEPFVGKAGQLLTDIIEKGMRLRRRDVYICNVVKCRPPNNRDPEPDEVAACAPFLARQIEIVAPEVIVALGRFAAQALLATSSPIGSLRGRWQTYRGIPVMPTLHPAYLLRNPGDKRLVWADVKQVMERLGIPHGPAAGPGQAS
jgi:DNA polymerase